MHDLALTTLTRVAGRHAPRIFEHLLALDLGTQLVADDVVLRVLVDHALGRDVLELLQESKAAVAESFVIEEEVGDGGHLALTVIGCLVEDAGELAEATHHDVAIRAET